MAPEKSLVIVESPAKSKTIAKYLGEGFKVIASLGHIRDLPQHELGIDIENGFRPTYEILPGKEKIASSIRAEAARADVIYLAPDPDREGEAIAWHLAYVIKKTNKPVWRMTFNEITKEAVQRALSEKRQINMHRVDSQQTRRFIDRLVGYKASPFLWDKVKKGLSAGRVQSIALKLVCDRETEIESYLRTEIYNVSGTFDGKIQAKLILISSLKPDITTRSEAEYAKSEILKDRNFVVTKVDESEKTSAVIKPFITATLQQEASNRLGLSPDRAMKIAQELYEGVDVGGDIGRTGVITYMRTDSTRVSEQFAEKAKDYIKSIYGKDYVLPFTPSVKLKDSAQDAHEAIRPTLLKTPDELAAVLSEDQKKLYQLIWTRFLASQMAPPRQKIFIAEFTGRGFVFQSRLAKLLFDGYQKILPQSKQDADKDAPLIENLTDLKVNQKASLTGLDVKQGYGNTPQRYSEASLIKDLEDKGIGRPSTYAATLSSLFKREYAVRDKKYIAPEEIGRKVSEVLTTAFPDIFQVSFTARMETDLDKIEQDEQDMNAVLQTFYDSFDAMLNNAQKYMESLKGSYEGKAAPQKTGKLCPQCGKELVIRKGKKSDFIACSGFPACRYTEFPKPLAIKPCPACGKDMFLKSGAYGKFLGCSGYPDCKHKEMVIDPTKKSSAPVKKCPKCGKDMFKKKTRDGNTFVGCSGYPDCKYAEPVKSRRGAP
jgi:DNA topoisomerase I